MIKQISANRQFPAEWTDRREDVVMANPRIGVIQHVLTCGSDGQPKFDQPILVNHAGVVCIPLDRQDNIVMIRRYREVCQPTHAIRTVPITDGSTCGVYSTEFPRGGCEAGEAAGDAALRETEEELGLTALSVTELGRSNADTAFFPYSHEVFVVEIDSSRKTNRPVDPNEEIEVVRTRLPELLRWLAEGRICCGLTQAALMLHVARLAASGKLENASAD